MTGPFEAAQRVADAVLYEGYVLYPYHASSDKNRVRFQFGVVAPRDFSEADRSESWEMQTECLLKDAGEARLDLRVRFLQLQSRVVEAVDPTVAGGFAPVASLEVDGETVVAWDEAVERQIDDADVAVAELLRVERAVPFTFEGGEDVEEVQASPADHPAGSPAGRVVRTRWAIDGLIRSSAERVDGAIRLRVRIENLSSSPSTSTARDAALRRSLLGCHTLVAIRNGEFMSMIDPPAELAAAAKASANVHTWPVLVGESGQHDLLLSSPIILYDYPAIAPESQGDLYDSTEIDEILTLRIMTLTDAEKKAARATDPRARAIIDAADDMPPEIFDRLHGAIRYLRETPDREIRPERGADAAEPAGADDGAGPADPAAAIQPWTPDLGDPDWLTLREPTDDRVELPPSVWQPDARVVPDRAAIEIGGMTISKGAFVRLRPTRRADSMDVFLAGKTATVEAVYESVDDDTHVGVTLDDDPGADLYRSSGRFFYFAPDELEPLAPAPAGNGSAPVLLEPSSRSLAER